MASAITAQKFLEALYESAETGYIEIRPLLEDSDPRKSTKEGNQLQGRMRRWFQWPADVEKCGQYVESLKGKDFHVFYGVALRKAAGSGTKADVACCTAVFADVDFQDVDPEEVKRLLKEFPYKPSIIMKSGNGIHIYWLLKEPVVEGSFQKLESVNRRMLVYLKAKTGPQDVSRILRLPGTINIKKKYPDPKPLCNVTWLHTENCYILDDFEQYLPEEPAVKTYHLAPPPGSNGAGAPPESPNFELDDETIDECAKLIEKVWLSGFRHHVALHVAGWCAHSGYSKSSAEKLISHVCDLTKDAEVEDRLVAVRDSYSKYTSGQKVGAFTSLEKMIKESFPEIISEQVMKVVQMIRKSAPKVKKNAQSNGISANGAPPANGMKQAGIHADFRLVKNIKFDSRPARYCVTVEKDGHEVVANCETTGHFMNYPRFQELVYEQTDVVLTTPLKPGQWHRMISAMGAPEIRPAPKESSPDGALGSAIEEFLQDARENPEVGILKKFAGYDEEATFFRTEALMDFLVEKALKITQPHLSDHLRGVGWDNSIRRFGRKVVRLWVKKGPPEPHRDHDVTPNTVTGGFSLVAPATPSVTPEKAPEGDLFPKTTQEEAF